MAQFEKLWGDMTALPGLECRYVAVARVRGQQLKEVAQLDAWLRDGSAEAWNGSAGGRSGGSSHPIGRYSILPRHSSWDVAVAISSRSSTIWPIVIRS